MTTSDNQRTGTDRPDRPGLSDRVSGLSRDDLLLAAIPLSFVLSLLVYAALPVELHTAVWGSAAVGAVVLADALFFNPPLQPPSGSGSGADPETAAGDAGPA
jgi:hypothetical protein